MTGGTDPSDTDQPKAEPEQTLESILEEWRRSLSWLAASWFVVFMFSAFGVSVVATLFPLGFAGYSIYRMWQQVADGEDDFGIRPCPSHSPPWMTPTVTAGPDDPRALAIGCLWYWLRWFAPTWAVSLVPVVGFWPQIFSGSYWGLLGTLGVALPFVLVSQAVRKTLPDRKRHFFGPLF